MASASPARGRTAGRSPNEDDVVKVYVDNDNSAYSGKPRPQYRQMLDDIKSGLIRAVVVWHLDRVHR
jgi:DNA invertase Pin-like site-specific DNA recombinase